MNKLTLLSNPTREQVNNWFLNITLYRACIMFFKEINHPDDRNRARYCVRLMRDYGVLPTSNKYQDPFRIRDFLSPKYNHTEAINTIETKEELSLSKKECLDTYAQLVSFLKQYLNSTLKAYGFTPVTFDKE